MSYFEITRYHDFSYGHRVAGHEGKCQLLHGHNGRVHFTCISNNYLNDPKPVSRELGRGNHIHPCNDNELDHIGRVADFDVVKSKLCNWVEQNWDHRFLAYDHDPLIVDLFSNVENNAAGTVSNELYDMLLNSIVWIPFNPTAENMARYLVDVIGPKVLVDTNIVLVKVVIEETHKCSGSYHALPQSQVIARNPAQGVFDFE